MALARAEGERAEGAAAAARLRRGGRTRSPSSPIPFRTAYARLREAEAALADGADGREVAGPLGEARALASDIGAPLLLAEIEALARRARVPLETADEPEPTADGEPSPTDRLGLTPREVEVLVLLAEGHTNREIGERLYMSAKTASVHVSRILVEALGPQPRRGRGRPPTGSASPEAGSGDGGRRRRRPAVARALAAGAARGRGGATGTVRRGEEVGAAARRL